MAVNIHITIIELNALHRKGQNGFQELDAVIHLLMEAKHWGLRKSRNATSLNSRFKSLDTLKVKIISVKFFFFSSRRRYTRSLCDWSSDVCSSDLPLKDWAEEEGIADEEIRDRILAASDAKMNDKAAAIGPDLMRRVEKSIVLQMIDQGWRDQIGRASCRERE